MDIRNNEILGGDGWRDLLKDGHSILGRHHTAQIINELCRSIDDPQCANAIDDLINQMRLAFHRERPGDLQAQSVDFTEAPAEFLEAISDAPEELRDKLILAYDTVWLHESPETLFLYGEKASGIAKTHLNYQVEQIEQAARMYLDLPGAHSPTLEWAIVNSLLYAESLAFLQTVTFAGNIFAGASSAKGLSPWKIMLTSVGSLLWEGVKLLATAAISYAIGQEDRTASIVLFLAITGARWFIPTQKGRQQEKISVLAQAMMGAHGLAKRRAFNAGVVRQQAYHATTLGAVFSDYVYEILDRQILRASEQARIG